MNTQSAPVFNHSKSSELHIDTEACPWCGQEIPPEKLEEASGRIAAREHEQAQAITRRLEKEYLNEKAEAEVRSKAQLELERQRSAQREALARDEARKAAEEAAIQKLAESEKASRGLQTTLRHQIDEAQAARTTVEQTNAALQLEMRQVRLSTETELATVKAQAKARETEIYAEAKKEAQAHVAHQLTTIESEHRQSQMALQAKITEVEANKMAAESKSLILQEQLGQAIKQKDEEVAKIKEAAVAQEVQIRCEAAEATESLVRERTIASEKAVTEAQAKCELAERKLAKQSEEFEDKLNERLRFERQALEKAKEDAINLERAKAFEENQKLSNKVADLQRALDNKTADELGEGAELDLFEALKSEFPDDRITRIAKGTPGADIKHVVLCNGQECGTIIYDSKNHKAFRNDHVEKLREDQIAARAEHAILSTHKFPQGTRQLHVQDGVLLANPARVLAVVTLIREHILQSHTLRLSSAERKAKTAKLYAFVTSERCRQLFSRIDSHTEELLELQVKEKKSHESAWKKQGETICSIQRVGAELSTEIGRIIGTAPDVELEPDES